MAPYIINMVGGLGAGVVAYSILTGIVTVQTAVYFSTFKTDRPGIKVAVAFLCIYDMFQLVVLASSVYTHAISHWANQTALIEITWQITMYQVGIILASVVTQLFLVFRMWHLTRQPLLPIIIIVFIILHFSLGIAVQVRANQAPDFFVIMTRDRVLCICWLLCAALVDTVIGIGMCYHLYARRTGFKQTDNILRIMAIFAINTGLVTGVVSLVVLIVFSFDGFAWIVMFGGVPLGGLYSTTMLANIHSRSIFKRKLEEDAGAKSIPIPLQSLPTLRKAASVSKLGEKAYSINSTSPFAMATSLHTTSGSVADVDLGHPMSSYQFEPRLSPISVKRSNEIIVDVQQETHVVVEGDGDADAATPTEPPQSGLAL